MNIVIRKGTEADLPIVLSFIKKLHKLEKSKLPLTNTVALMKKEKKFFDFIAAEIHGEIIGVAIFFFAYFTYTGKSLYLEVLFVKKEYRDKGIGSKLLRRIFEIAKKEHCTRLTWQVDETNEKAIKYYQKKGAEINYKSLNCDFHQKDIKKFLQQNPE